MSMVSRRPTPVQSTDPWVPFDGFTWELGPEPAEAPDPPVAPYSDDDYAGYLDGVADASADVRFLDDSPADPRDVRFLDEPDAEGIAFLDDECGAIAEARELDARAELYAAC